MDVDFWADVQKRLDAEERTQAWLARRLGVTRSLINQYMLGRIPTPEARRTQVAQVMGMADDEVAA